MKFDSVIYALAFLALALISWPSDKEAVAAPEAQAEISQPAPIPLSAVELSEDEEETLEEDESEQLAAANQ